MKLNAVDFGEALPIDSYGPGFFRIGGEVFEGHVIANGAGVTAWAGFSDIEALLALQPDIDVVFCGMGADVAHMPQAAARALQEAGLAYEVMATDAACRTYNVLLSEGRRVAAALITV